MPTIPEQCIDALHEAADRLGTSPTKAAYEQLGLQPASATIIRQMGGWNRAKEAAGLPTYPSTGPRTRDPPADLDITEEEWNSMSVDQRWHYRNVEWNAERTSNRRARLRQWVNEVKRTMGCGRGGLRDESCLDLHHLHSHEKERAVGKLITHGYGKQRLRREIEKCEVLCANCHRLEHNKRATSGMRFRVEAYKASLGCKECGQANPVVLDCHHQGEKGSTIARMLANDRPPDQVYEELQQCVVVCANCHRRMHFDPPTPGG